MQIPILAAKPCNTTQPPIPRNFVAPSRHVLDALIAALRDAGCPTAGKAALAWRLDLKRIKPQPIDATP